MAYTLDRAGVARLHEYFDKRIGAHLRDRRKRESFAMYAMGLLSESERKSAEPLAALACCDPERARATHDKLLHFVGRASWDDAAVRRAAVDYAIEALATQEPVTTWIIDDTGFIKQGKHSVCRRPPGSAAEWPGSGPGGAGRGSKPSPSVERERGPGLDPQAL